MLVTSSSNSRFPMAAARTPSSVRFGSDTSPSPSPSPTPTKRWNWSLKDLGPRIEEGMGDFRDPVITVTKMVGAAFFWDPVKDGVKWTRKGVVRGTKALTKKTRNLVGEKFPRVEEKLPKFSKKESAESATEEAEALAENKLSKNA